MNNLKRLNKEKFSLLGRVIWFENKNMKGYGIIKDIAKYGQTFIVTKSESIFIDIFDCFHPTNKNEQIYIMSDDMKKELEVISNE